MEAPSALARKVYLKPGRCGLNPGECVPVIMERGGGKYQPCLYLMIVVKLLRCKRIISSRSSAEVPKNVFIPSAVLATRWKEARRENVIWTFRG